MISVLSSIISSTLTHTLSYSPRRSHLSFQPPQRYLSRCYSSFTHCTTQLKSLVSATILSSHCPSRLHFVFRHPFCGILCSGRSIVLYSLSLPVSNLSTKPCELRLLLPALCRFASYLYLFQASPLFTIQMNHLRSMISWMKTLLNSQITISLQSLRKTAMPLILSRSLMEDMARHPLLRRLWFLRFCHLASINRLLQRQLRVL